MYKLVVNFVYFFFISFFSFLYLTEAKSVDFINNGSLKPAFYSTNFNNSSDYPTIIKQTVVHLNKYPGKYLQPDGSFLFQVPTDGGRMYHYPLIEGTNNNDHIRLNGKLIINELNMLKGFNTLTLEANSEIRLDPGVMGKPSGLVFKNVSVFNIQHGVKLDKLVLSDYDKNITINFSSPDSSLEANNTILQNFTLDSSNSFKESYININNAKVWVKGKALFSYSNDNITLKDAEINKDGSLNNKTVSSLVLDKGLSNPGGNNIINMGNHSLITITNGSLELHGNNTLNMKVGSQIKGSLILKDGTSVINIEGGDKVKYKEEINKVNIAYLTLNNKQVNLNIKDYANFKVNSDLGSSGVTNIFVGKNSIFEVNGTVGFFNSNNTLYLDEMSETKGIFKFSGIGNNNHIFVNTGQSQVTLNGGLIGSRNNDSFTLLGKGVFYVNSTSPGDGLDGFNNINLGQGRIEFAKHSKQSQDTKYIISILPKDYTEDNPRLKYNGLAYFNNTTINLKFNGVTKNLGRVGEVYNLTLLRVGEENSGQLKKISDIALKELTFKSAIYNLKWEIKNDSDLTLKLEKYRTFKEAVGSKEDYSIKEGIVEIAGFLDKLVDIKELNQKYYDMLDELSMIDEVELKQALRSFIPINNTILFNINKNLAQEFTEVTLNAKPYKIVKNDLVFWTNYQRTHINIDNKKGIIGGQSTSTPLMGGIEFSATNFLKIGGLVGATQSNIKGNLNYYTGKSNNFYYGVYGGSSLTNNLTLNMNLGILNSNYNLTRSLFNGETVYVAPQFKQVNIDGLLSYKIRVTDHFMITPFISASYNHSTMGSYNEKGDMAYEIDNSVFKEFSSGIGLKGVLVGELTWGYFIPSINLGLYNNLQNSKDTNAHMLAFSDLKEAINFSTQSYGGLVGKGELTISYNLNNGIILDLKTGTKIGKDFKSYNIGASFSLTL